MATDDEITDEDKTFARDRLMDYVLKLYEEASIHSGWTSPPPHIEEIMDVIWKKATALAQITAPQGHTRSASGE